MKKKTFCTVKYFRSYVLCASFVWDTSSLNVWVWVYLCEGTWRYKFIDYGSTHLETHSSKKYKAMPLSPRRDKQKYAF